MNKIIKNNIFYFSIIMVEVMKQLRITQPQVQDNLIYNCKMWLCMDNLYSMSYCLSDKSRQY
jgi:hypothetical protein